jgi:glycosyltransferase involved in cell wall biosynthesis
MRVVVVEPFYGGSHRAWADGYATHSAHEVHLVTHADEAWRWRLRGGALTIGEDIASVVGEVGPPDVVLVSDMVDLPALLGFARAAIGTAPVAVYFHESQLLYPVKEGGEPDRHLALVNWLSLAAADLALFNSAFHRDRLLAELPSFLEQVADGRHVDRVESVAARSEVLPVGVDLGELSPDRRPPADGQAPLVVWSHRWEWDKQVDRALRMLVGAAERGVDFRVALLGEQPDRLPVDVEASVGALGERVVHRGHLSRAEYVDVLLHGDVVVSTAKQEFFGIAMVEAMAAGCVPVLPDDLSYPEIVPRQWHAAALHDRRADGPSQHLDAVLGDLPAARRRVDGLADSMRRFDWTTVAPRYDDRLRQLAADRR